MKIIGRHASQVRAAVREAVRVTRRRNPGLSERLLGAQHSSGGLCLTFLDNGTTRTRWLPGMKLSDFPYLGASVHRR